LFKIQIGQSYLAVLKVFLYIVLVDNMSDIAGTSNTIQTPYTFISISKIYTKIK